MATSPELGLGCGNIGNGLGFMFVGEAKLNEVAGLDPKPVCVLDWLILEVCGLAGVWGLEPDGGVKGGWNLRPGSRCCAGDCGPRWWPTRNRYEWNIIDARHHDTKVNNIRVSL